MENSVIVDFEDRELNIKDGGNTERISCDLVIVGGGGAGVIAALRAHELGVKNVVLLEKQGRLGGNTWIANLFTGANSRAQNTQGIPDKRSELFLQTMETNKWEAEPAIVRRYLFASGEVIDWLMDHGLDFEFIDTMVKMPQRSPLHPGHNVSYGPGYVGSSVVEALSEKIKSIPEIDVRLRTKAASLLTNENGDLCGVEAVGDTGKMIITAKAVILAGGGFGGSPKMLAEHFPQYFGQEPGVVRRSLAQMKGDCIYLARELGADTFGMLAIELGGPCHRPWSDAIDRSVVDANSVWVNRLGQRFTAESDKADRHLILGKQPGAEMFAIYDENCKEVIKEHLRVKPNSKMEADILISQLDDDLIKENDGRRVLIAQTVDEMASFIGCGADALRETIETYNSYCQSGADGEFCKSSDYLKPVITPPFYCIYGRRYFDTTHGGITINERLQVLRPDGTAIRGLFAVGDNASGWGTQNYAPPGASLTWCFTSGYLSAFEAEKMLSEGK